MDEASAIERLQQGDIEGLRLVVQLHELEALRIAQLILRDRPAAEEVVQEAFLQAFRRIRGFESGRPFAPWFLKMVANEALKRARRRREIPYGIDPPAPRDGSDPALLIEEAETAEAVAAALDELSPGQRTAIVLRYYLGLSESEMAEHLGRSPGTVKWRLHVARERLRKLLSARRLSAAAVSQGQSWPEGRTK